MAKQKIKVMFWRKVQYCAEIEVTDEELETLQESDGDDIDQYSRTEGKITGNPAYVILEDYATEENECDWEGEFEYFEMNSIDE